MIIDGINYLIIEAKYSAPKCVLILARLDSQVKKMGLVTIPAWDENTLSSLDGLISSSALLLESFYDYDKDLADLLLMPEKGLDDLKADKAYQIKATCSKHILAGFSSNALGKANTYPSQRDDQLNLMGAVQRSMMTGVLLTDSFVYVCKGANGKWAYVSHSSLQIQQVGKDAYTHFLNSRLKNSTLQTRIDAAKTQAELDAINW